MLTLFLSLVMSLTPAQAPDRIKTSSSVRFDVLKYEEDGSVGTTRIEGVGIGPKTDSTQMEDFSDGTMEADTPQGVFKGGWRMGGVSAGRSFSGIAYFDMGFTKVTAYRLFDQNGKLLDQQSCADEPPILVRITKLSDTRYLVSGDASISVSYDHGNTWSSESGMEDLGAQGVLYILEEQLDMSGVVVFASTGNRNEAFFTVYPPSVELELGANPNPKGTATPSSKKSPSPQKKGEKRRRGRG